MQWAHPLVRDWFIGRFGSPTEPQAEGWPHIVGRPRHADLGADRIGQDARGVSRLHRSRSCARASPGTLTDRTEVVYVSPLKALGNDIQKNLDGRSPRSSRSRASAASRCPEIRTAVRTGDTPMPARRAMLTRPPHILVTTPESLYILLTAEQAAAPMLRDGRAPSSSTRFTPSPTTSAARIWRCRSSGSRRWPAGPLTRIGLSATQKPIEAVARVPRRAPAGPARSSSRSRRGASSIWPSKCRGASSARSPPTRCGTRSTTGSPRSSASIARRSSSSTRAGSPSASRIIWPSGWAPTRVAAHHGSLSRQLRLEAEQRLKAGELRVARRDRVARTRHRHRHGRSRLPDRIAALDCRRAAAHRPRGPLARRGPEGPPLRDHARRTGRMRGARARDPRAANSTALVIPDAPLDILAQQIVAACAAEEWSEDDLFALRRAAPIRTAICRARTSTRSSTMLARRHRGQARPVRRVPASRPRQRPRCAAGAARGSRRSPAAARFRRPACTPSSPSPKAPIVGTVDEDFAVESMAGDVMLLGNTSWRIRRVSIAGRVLVEDAHGAAPTIPFWRGEAPARTPELSAHVGEVRQTVSDLAPDARPDDAAHGAPAAAAGDRLARRRVRPRPSRRRAGRRLRRRRPRRARRGADRRRPIIAERFFDEGGGMQLVIHAPFGARINKAWGLALRKRFCRSFNFELQAAATDNGINIALAEQHSFPLADVFHFLHTATVARRARAGGARLADVRHALALGRRPRAGAAAFPRRQEGAHPHSADAVGRPAGGGVPRRRGVSGEHRRRHPDSRSSARPRSDEGRPDRGDGPRRPARRCSRDIADGTIRCVAVDTPVPSLFSHEILNANPYAFLDDAPLEERRARAVEMRRVLPESVLVGSRPARSRRRLRRCSATRGRTCATPTICTTRC